MKNFRTLFLAMVLVIMSFSTVFAENNVEVKTSILDSISRYIFQIKDASGCQYNIYIVPVEQELLLKNWTWAKKSDTIIKGSYVFFINKSNTDIATLQKVYPFESNKNASLDGIFNLTTDTFKNRAFVLYGTKYNPDILFITQQLTGSGDSSVRAFYIDNNFLKIIRWENNSGILLNTTYTDGINPIVYTDQNTIIIPSWRRNPEYSGGVISTWLFSSNEQICKLKEVSKTKTII